MILEKICNNYKLRQIASLLMVFCVIVVTFTIRVSAEVTSTLTLNVTEPDENGNIIISGNLPIYERAANYDKLVTVLILKPSKSIDRFGKDPLKDVIQSMGQVNINASVDGHYSYTYKMDEKDVTGMYTVIVGGTDSNSSIQKSFYYVNLIDATAIVTEVNNTKLAEMGLELTKRNDALRLDLNIFNGVNNKDYVYSALVGKQFKTVNEIIKAFNNALALVRVNEATIATMSDILSYHKSVLGIDVENESDYTKLSNKIPVYAALAGKNFTTIISVQDAFKSAVTAQKQVEIIEAAVRAVNEATTADEMGSVLQAKKDILGIDFSGSYTDFDSVCKEKVHVAILERKPFSTADDIKNAFYGTVALLAVNTQQDRGAMGDVLQKNNATFKLDLDGDYSRFDQNDKAIVHKALIGKNFNSIDAIKTAFKTAVENVRNEVESDNKKSSSTKTSSVKSNVSITPELTPVPTVAPSPKQGFDDITDVPWASDAIRSLADKGIIIGVADKKFNPHDLVTREQFVKMLMSAFSLVDQSAESEFNDVEKDAWYYRYIATAQKLGIIQGVNKETFGISMSITRQEMSVLAYRTAQKANISLSGTIPAIEFSDIDQISPYALEGIKVMQQAGILGGVGDNKFAPSDGATRAEAAKVIFDLLKYIE